MQPRDEINAALVSPKILHYLAQTLSERGIDVSDDEVWRTHCPGGEVPHTWRPPFSTLKVLVERALDMADDDDLGIDVGTRVTFGTFALLIPAMLTCNTLTDALLTGLKYQQLTGSLLAYHTGFSQDSQVTLDIQSRFADASIRRFLMHMEMCVLVNVVRYLVGRRHKISHVQTSYEPADMQRLRRHCGCAVTIAPSSNRLYLSMESLATPLPTSDPYAHAEVLEALDAALQREASGRDIVQKVQAIFVRALPHMSTAAEVAATLGISQRSLRRKLAEADTSYRALVTRIRLDRARDLLKEGNLSQSEIAYELGFESTRSLRRLLTSWGRTL